MKQQINIKNLAKYAAACASSFDPDTVIHMAHGYSDGYKAAIKDIHNWLDEHIRTVDWMNGKCSSINYPKTKEEFFTEFEKEIYKTIDK